MKTCLTRILVLAVLTLGIACGGPEPETSEPAPAGGEEPAAAPALPAGEESPFHEEVRRWLREGKVDDAVLTLGNALDLDPFDTWSQMVLAGLYLHTGDPNRAAHRYLDALQTRGNDCLLALGLATARRRVDTAAGSSAVFRDVLEAPGCPPAAYGVALERLARHEEDQVAEARLPAGGPDETGARTLRLLEPRPEGPGFAELATAVHQAFGGRLIFLGDRFVDLSPRHRVEGLWVAADLALLDAVTGPADAEELGTLVEQVLESWREPAQSPDPGDAWQVGGWTTFEDVRGRFRIETPEGWFANLFQGAGGALYTFAPLEIDEAGAAPVRSGEMPAWDLTIQSRSPDGPPPWEDEEVERILAEISAPFAVADHATEPWAELLDERDGKPPGLLLKRTFLVGEEVYRVAAAEMVGPEHTYRFAFGGPAARVDRLEQQFWRFVRSLHPTSEAPGQEE